MEKSSYQNSIRVILVSNDFYGKNKRKLTQEKIVEKIQQYDFEALQIVLCKWQLLLNERETEHPLWQYSFSKLFCNNAQRKRLRRILQKEKRQILTKDVVLNLTKLNLHYNQAGGNTLETDEMGRGLFRILLALNDIYVKEMHNPQEPDVELIRETLRYSMAKQVLGINTSSMQHQLYRGKKLIENVLNHFPRFSEYFEEATGVKLVEYHEIIFMLLLDWSGVGKFQPLETSVKKNIENYFRNVEIDMEVVQNVVDMLSFEKSDYEEINNELNTRARLSSNLDDQSNYLIFYAKQLLKLNDGYLCLSPNALTMQFTEGPYNILRQHLQSLNDREALDQLPNWWGKAYEMYILESLRRSFGDKLETDLVINNQPSIDALIDFGDTIFLIEIKYPHWKFSTRVNPTRDAIEEQVSKFVGRNKGLGQIKRFIDHYSDEANRSAYNLNNKLIIPILILGEEFPFDPFNREVVTNYARVNNLISARDNVLPYIILTTSEVENIEGLAEERGDELIKNLMGMYSSHYLEEVNPGYKDMPSTFMNILIFNHIAVRNSSAMRNDLEQVFDVIGRRFAESREMQN